MSNKCLKCKDGLITDCNASGHSGENIYPCDCDAGIDIILQDILKKDMNYGLSLGKYVSCLRNQLIVKDKEIVKLKKTPRRLIAALNEQGAFGPVFNLSELENLYNKIEQVNGRR